MKYILIIIILATSINLQGQIKGNGKIITQEIPLENVKVIELGLYAKTTITNDGKEYIKITADENLLPLIKKSLSAGKLIIDQLEWIQSSKDIVINIGAPNLEKFIQSTHDQTLIKSFNGEKLEIDANTGNIDIQGEVRLIEMTVGVVKIDASNLAADEGRFFFESRGEVKASVTGSVTSNSKGDGRLLLMTQPKEFHGNTKYLVHGKELAKDDSIRFIKFKLRNNSTNRNQFYVVGPKADGSNFSYGFPMMPYQIRDKDWTNGTKVYKVNNLGLRKLVKVIKLEDEGQTINIFEK